MYCRTHNVSVCLYIGYIVCGSASLYIKTLYFFLTLLALSVAATVAKIKIRYDAKTHQFAIIGTCVIYVFYSMYSTKRAVVSVYRESMWPVMDAMSQDAIDEMAQHIFRIAKLHEGQK